MSDVFHPPPVSAGVGTPPVTNRYDTDTGGWVIFAGVNAIVQQGCMSQKEKCP